jgi:hypothetical protein
VPTKTDPNKKRHKQKQTQTEGQKGETLVRMALKRNGFGVLN